MKKYKVMLFDPSFGTLNKGDQIISDSCRKELNYYLKNKFVIGVSTHQPLLHFHQVYGNNIYSKQLKEVENIFVLGSNLLQKDVMITRKRPWNIHFLGSKGLKDAILVGVGSNGKNKRDTIYTRLLYKKVLSKKYYHSVRDEETREYVESLGLKALNTGCATMWSLTPDHCKNIKNVKSENVVFTLTDYAQDIELDSFQVATLQKLYGKVYFWPQGSEDLEYFHKLKIDQKNIIILGSDIEVPIDRKRTLTTSVQDFMVEFLRYSIKLGQL